MSNGKLLAGLAIGALVGSAISCFAHSNRGKKFKNDLHSALQDLEDDACEYVHRAKRKAEKAGSEVADKVNQRAEEVKSKLADAANK